MNYSRMQEQYSKGLGYSSRLYSNDLSEGFVFFRSGINWQIKSIFLLEIFFQFFKSSFSLIRNKSNQNKFAEVSLERV